MINEYVRLGQSQRLGLPVPSIHQQAPINLTQEPQCEFDLKENSAIAIDLTRIWRIQSKARKSAIVLLFFTATCLLITSSTQRFQPLPPLVALHATDGRASILGSTTRTDIPELTTNINTLQSTTSKYTYATLFTEGAKKEEDDKYLIYTRMLTYQLLHDPATRNERSIPFIVLVPPSVSHSKRHRLQSEGATVVEVPTKNFSWMKPGRDRWAHVMDKLNVYKLVQCEKLLLLDSDIVIFKGLDDIFESPMTEIRTNLGNSSNVKDDEGPQPQRYLMAGDTSPEEGIKHSWPAKRRPSPINAGFVVLHPSEEMYEYNMRIASIEGRFSSSALEQNLWNFIHRPDGNMPWNRIKHTWIMNSPKHEDYKNGIAAVHEKWFRRSQEDPALKEELQKSRWKMEGFWARGPLYQV